MFQVAAVHVHLLLARMEHGGAVAELAAPVEIVQRHSGEALGQPVSFLKFKLTYL